MVKDNYSEDSVRNYVFLKNSYKRVVSHFKSTYCAMLSDEIINARGSADFWRAVRKLSPTAGGCQSVALDLEDVSRHFSQLFNSSPSPTNFLPTQNSFVDSLDRDFVLSELDSVLLSCKSGKAAGCDGVAYEFFVNLDWSNRCRLLDCLNGVLQSEEIPGSWSRLNMFLLLKKGDPALVTNYRGISLLNCFAKLSC